MNIDIPPSGPSVDNHPEPVFHPRMNSRFEQRAVHCVRTPLTLHTSCHSSVCCDCFIFTVSSPLCSPIDPAATADYTAAGYDYFVDDPAPTGELPGKQSHSLPQISPIFSVLSC